MPSARDLVEEVASEDSDEGSEAELFEDEEINKHSIWGMRLVPVDLVIEHIRSQGIQFFVALTLFYRFATIFILKGNNQTTCWEARALNNCLPSDDGTFHTGYKQQSIQMSQLVMQTFCLLGIGVCNSLYLTTQCKDRRSCRPACITGAKVVGLFFCFVLVMFAYWDFGFCHSNVDTPLQFCTAEHAATETSKCMTQILDPELSTVSWAMLPGLKKVQDPLEKKVCKLMGQHIVNTINTTDCPAPFWKHMTVEQAVCECRQVASCYRAFKASVGTVVTVTVYHLLLIGLLFAILWDMFGVCVPEKYADMINGLEWLSRPFIVSLTLSWLLGFDMCISLAYGTGAEIFSKAVATAESFLHGGGEEEDKDEGPSWLMTHVGPLFFILMLISFTIASAVNFYMYMQHSKLLARVPWKFLDQSDMNDKGEEDKDDSGDGADEKENDISEDEGEGMCEPEKEKSLAFKEVEFNEEYIALRKEADALGLLLDDIRTCNWMSCGWYFGLAWASMMLGSFLFAITLIMIFVISHVMIHHPGLRKLAWEVLFFPVLRIVAAVAFLQALFCILRRCLWGPSRKFPRRPALLANINLVMLLLSMQASFLLGLSRLIKTYVPSTVGMMMVTFTMGGNSGYLKDAIVGFYGANMRMERYHQALELGEVKERNPYLDCKTHLTDIGWTTGAMGGISAGLVFAIALVALLFGEPFSKGFEQGLSALSVFAR